MEQRFLLFHLSFLRFSEYHVVPDSILHEWRETGYPKICTDGGSQRGNWDRYGYLRNREQNFKSLSTGLARNVSSEGTAANQRTPRSLLIVSFPFSQDVRNKIHVIRRPSIARLSYWEVLKKTCHVLKKAEILRILLELIEIYYCIPLSSCREQRELSFTPRLWRVNGCAETLVVVSNTSLFRAHYPIRAYIRGCFRIFARNALGFETNSLSPVSILEFATPRATCRGPREHSSEKSKTELEHDNKLSLKFLAFSSLAAVLRQVIYYFFSILITYSSRFSSADQRNGQISFLR